MIARKLIGLEVKQTIQSTEYFYYSKYKCSLFPLSYAFRVCYWTNSWSQSVNQYIVFTRLVLKLETLDGSFIGRSLFVLNMHSNAEIATVTCCMDYVIL